MRIYQLFLALFVSLTLHAQGDSGLWTGYFSYNSIKDIAYGDDRVFVAAENAIYTYDIWTEQLSNITTIEGLSGENITQIHYSQDYNLLLVGHDNGLIEIITNDQVLQIVAILDKPSIPPNIKAINYFYEYEGRVYVATDFGISVFDLALMEFGDTYYIGELGSTIAVNQITIQGSFIYAATAQNGIKKALLDGPDLIDYTSWETVTGGGIIAIQTLNDAVYFARTNQRVLRLTPEPVQIMADYGSDPIVDMRVQGNVLTITTEKTINTYGADFSPIDVATLPLEIEDQFSVGLGFADQIFAGTQANGLQKKSSGQFDWTTIGPQGPLFNNPFSIDASSGQLWVGFGEVTVSFNPFPLSYRGLSQFKNDQWNNIPAANLFGASDIVHMKINPLNPEEVFASSFQFGLLKITSGVPETLYDQNTSSLTIPVDNPGAGLRIYGSDFDRDNNLWFVQSKIDQGLLRLSPSGQIGKIDLSGIINAEDELALTDLKISREGYIFFGSAENGLIGFNPSTNSFNRITEGSGNGNLPSTDVRSLAFDKNNRLWLGTREGLRVLYNTTGFFQSGNNVEAQPIIILEEGVPQELLFQQSVTDIEVDGSNNKWITTATSGVFYLSANGQETLLRFTKENSPLPSDNVQDIAIDGDTGTVYFATTKGLVAFEGSATDPRDDLSQAYVYPNPVRPGFQGQVTVDGLSAGANVKITDIEGNLVFEDKSQGGSVLWDTRAFGRHRVASGVYLVLITSEDAFETKVLKIMIVR